MIKGAKDVKNDKKKVIQFRIYQKMGIENGWIKKITKKWNLGKQDNKLSKVTGIETKKDEF